jgi:hypothetical protein
MRAFMQPEEHLIFMDMQVRYEEPLIRLPAEDIKLLVDAGIKTAMMFNVDWGVIEPEKGKRDYSYFRDRVNLLHECGMKVMVQCFTFLPKWVPDSWKIRNQAGAYLDMISPWNDEAMDYVLAFIRDMVCEFESNDTMAVNSWLTDGETLFPNEVCIYDDCAQQKFQALYGRLPNNPLDLEERMFLFEGQLELMQKIQGLLRNNRYNDVWLALHPALAGYIGNGCEFISEILQSLEDKYPCVHINHLYCTWTQWDGIYPLMNIWKERHDERVFGGAEYAEGVVNQTYKAIEHKIRGLLIGPCHPYTGHTRVEPWMLNNIKEACRIWNENRSKEIS